MREGNTATASYTVWLHRCHFKRTRFSAKPTTPSCSLLLRFRRASTLPQAAHSVPAAKRALPQQVPTKQHPAAEPVGVLQHLLPHGVREEVPLQLAPLLLLKAAGQVAHPRRRPGRPLRDGTLGGAPKCRRVPGRQGVRRSQRLPARLVLTPPEPRLLLLLLRRRLVLQLPDTFGQLQQLLRLALVPAGSGNGGGQRAKFAVESGAGLRAQRQRRVGQQRTGRQHGVGGCPAGALAAVAAAAPRGALLTLVLLVIEVNHVLQLVLGTMGLLPPLPWKTKRWP
mmetsp:Transcript_44241/g.78196  ORF Transcript_44241/g.78196 Transcript_44241/m.78196 type:complete len:282 (-) Transcript_44241:887-1732(-)